VAGLGDGKRVGRSGLGGGRGGLLAGVVEGADVHERALGQVVALAVAEALEGVDRLLERECDALEAGEDFGDVEGLREEALDLAGAADGPLVLFAQFVDAEDGDDVLEVLVALEDRWTRWATR
jgi:hypothetical protein